MSEFEGQNALQLVLDFERRHGFSLPKGLADALGQNRTITFEHKIFHGKVPLGPIFHAESSTGAQLEDFGYKLKPVDNYMGFREEHCFVIDPFETGDAIFLVGRDGRFGPELMFADHETGDIIELFHDVDQGVQYGD